MLQIIIPKRDNIWDEERNEFLYLEKDQVIQLEHSLVSLSKWESKWHVPFLTKENKTTEQLLDYIRCMTLTQNVPPVAYYCIPESELQRIRSYIDDNMTATTITEQKTSGGSREQITSELIYYWMISLNIPFECQKWHLSRLITLVRVCSIKNGPQKKMTRREAAERHASINEMNRKRLNTKG